MKFLCLLVGYRRGHVHVQCGSEHFLCIQSVQVRYRVGDRIALLLPIWNHCEWTSLDQITPYYPRSSRRRPPPPTTNIRDSHVYHSTIKQAAIFGILYINRHDVSKRPSRLKPSVDEREGKRRGPLVLQSNSLEMPWYRDIHSIQFLYWDFQGRSESLIKSARWALRPCDTHALFILVAFICIFV